MSVPPWNDANLLAPDYNLYKCNVKNIKLDRLRQHLESSIQVLENQKELHLEAAMVSRLIYLMGRKLRHDIGLSYLKKTNSALRKYLSLDFLNILKNYSASIPTSNSSVVEVPSRQMFEYVLLRLQSLCLLLFKATRYAYQSGCFFFDRLLRGDVAWMSLIPYSTLSKVWFGTTELLEKCKKMYTDLMPFRLKFKEIGPALLPEDYIFPNDIGEWMKEEIPEENYNFLKPDNVSYMSAKLHDIVDDLLEKDKTITESKTLAEETEIKEQPIINTYSKSVKSEIDIGTAVSREELLKIKNELTTREKKTEHKATFVKKPIEKYKHCISSVKDKASLEKFLKKENIFREKNNSKSLSSHLGFMQWQSLKTVMLGVCEKSKENEMFSKKIVMDLQHTWKTRCKK